MSATNDDQPSSSFQAKRGLLIGFLLLFLAGGLYWFSTTPTSTPSSAPASNTATKASESATEAAQAPISTEKAAQDLPELATDNAEPATKASGTVATNKVNPIERTRIKRSVNSAPDDVEPTETPARVADAPAIAATPVEKPAIVAAPPVAPAVKPEVAPVAKSAVVATAPTAKPASPTTTGRSKSGVPGDLKPVVQPAPAPVTVSAAPVLKRKTKNDEDVEVDFR